jgi:hypothetical protein
MKHYDSLAIAQAASRRVSIPKYDLYKDALARDIKAAVLRKERLEQVEFNKAVGDVVNKILETSRLRQEARDLEKRVDDYLNGRLDSLGKPSWSAIPYTPGEIMYQAKWRHDRANAIERDLYNE